MSVHDDFASRGDAELLREYALTGAEAPFNILIDRYSAMTYGSALRLLGDQASAEDAAQAAFLALMRKARQLPPGTSVAGWLQRAAGLAARDLRKVQRRRAVHERRAGQLKPQTAAYRNSTVSLDDVDESRRDLRGAIDAALAVLPDAQREALVLRFLAGKSRSEVAQELACSEATVQSRINRGRLRLRAILERQQIAPTVALVAWKTACVAARQQGHAALALSIRNACYHNLVSSAVRQMAQAVVRRVMWDAIKLRVACGFAVAVLSLWGALVFHSPKRAQMAITPPQKPLINSIVAAPAPLPTISVQELPVAVVAPTPVEEPDDFEIVLRPSLQLKAAQVAKPSPALAIPLEQLLAIHESQGSKQASVDDDIPNKALKKTMMLESETLIVQIDSNFKNGFTSASFKIGTQTTFQKKVNPITLHRP